MGLLYVDDRFDGFSAFNVGDDDDDDDADRRCASICVTEIGICTNINHNQLIRYVITQQIPGIYHTSYQSIKSFRNTIIKNAGNEAGKV